MKKKQVNVKLIGLFIIAIILFGLILFINSLLKEKPGEAITTIKKTKAAAKTYSRLLALNNPQPTITPTVSSTIEPSPTEILLANNNSTVTGSQYQNNSNLQSTPTSSQNQNNQLTPTISGDINITVGQDTPTVDPTTELLALNKNNLTITTTNGISPTGSVIPTKTKQLPETGWIQYSLILFASATTIFLLAFIF